MRNIIIFLTSAFFLLAFSMKSDQLREPSEISIGKLTLEKFIEIHNSGMKTLKTKDKSDSQKIKNGLSKYLKTKKLDIDFLKETDLSNANLKNLDMRYLNLKEANLSHADLTNTNLDGANLKEANATGTKFINSNLTRVDIHEAEGLTLKQLLACTSLYKTKLPEEFHILLKKEKPSLLKNRITKRF